MNLISSRNPHEALPIALDRLFKMGVERDSRNGKVLQLTGPTLIQYTHPLERVLFHPERDANPFFHLTEAMWMLAGRNDLAFVERYAARMRDFSDDGRTLNGAYGYRWRNHFGYDQLEWIIDDLQHNPNSRRSVLAMWDAGRFEEDMTGDLYLGFHGSKDVPCNTHAYFAINASGSLDITVCNRSNDLVWGCMGANAVQFSFLLEYMAEKIGVPVGSYYQFTNNLHGYLNTIEPLRVIAGQYCASPYELDQVEPEPLNVSESFDCDLTNLGESTAYNSKFFQLTVQPLEYAFRLYKQNQLTDAVIACDEIRALDWRIACKQWLKRRIERRLKKAQDDGVKYE